MPCMPTLNPEAFDKIASGFFYGHIVYDLNVAWCISQAALLHCLIVLSSMCLYRAAPEINIFLRVKREKKMLFCAAAERM